MITPISSLVTTSILLVVLVLLFRREERTGKRMFGTFRSHLDFWFLKIRHGWNVGVRSRSRYFARQILHYFIHTFLTGAIKGLDSLEERLKTVARSNRALAKKSDRERSALNKLDEIALHKMEVALSEEEKRIRKRKSIEE